MSLQISEYERLKLSLVTQHVPTPVAENIFADGSSSFYIKCECGWRSDPQRTSKDWTPKEAWLSYRQHWADSTNAPKPPPRFPTSTTRCCSSRRAIVRGLSR